MNLHGLPHEPLLYLGKLKWYTGPHDTKLKWLKMNSLLVAPSHLNETTPLHA